MICFLGPVGTAQSKNIQAKALIFNKSVPYFLHHHGQIAAKLRPTMINYSAKVITRDRPRKDGTVALCLQVFCGKERLRIALKVFCRPEDWDAERQEVKKTAPDCKKINALIGKYKAKAEEIFWDARMSERPVTATQFLEQLDTTPNLGSFSDWMEKEIGKEADIREAATVKSYVTTIRHLRNFRKNIAFHDLSFSLIQEFDRYLKKNKIANNGRAKYHRVVRKFILLAQKKLRRVPNPYAEFKFKEEYTEPVWLTPPEITALMDLYNSGTLPAIEEKVLRHFLFQMVTSVRVGTLIALRPDAVEGDILIIPPVKNTKRVVRVPLSEVAKELIAKRDGDKNKMFDCYTDVTMNRVLKDIAKKAGIKKNVTTHVARHTFGFMYLYAGGKLEELNEIMGHSKIETTMIYTHVDYGKKMEGVTRMQGIFKFDSSR